MTIEHQLEVPRELATQRIDQAVASLLPQYSRARLQAWIRSGQLTVDGELVRQKDKVCGGEEVTISAEEASLQAQPQDIPLAVLHEDD
ncbi:MAG: S4 domain-containing protein, partial [Pseudomonadales bacterium]